MKKLIALLAVIASIVYWFQTEQKAKQVEIAGGEKDKKIRKEVSEMRHLKELLSIVSMSKGRLNIHEYKRDERDGFNFQNIVICEGQRPDSPDDKMPNLKWETCHLTAKQWCIYPDRLEQVIILWPKTETKLTANMIALIYNRHFETLNFTPSYTMFR